MRDTINQRFVELVYNLCTFHQYCTYIHGTLAIFACVCVCVCAHMIHVCTYVRMHTMHVCVYACVCVCVCVRVHDACHLHTETHGLFLL